MPYKGSDYEVMLRTARLEDLGERLFDVALDKTLLHSLSQAEVRQQIHGCNEALDLLYLVISGYDDTYCPNCGSCGVAGCCPAPQCKYFDLYKGSIGDDLKEALSDARYWRDRGYAMYDLLTRIRQWDMLDSAADGAYWKGELDKVLRSSE